MKQRQPTIDERTKADADALFGDMIEEEFKKERASKLSDADKSLKSASEKEQFEKRIEHLSEAIDQKDIEIKKYKEQIKTESKSYESQLKELTSILESKQKEVDKVKADFSAAQAEYLQSNELAILSENQRKSYQEQVTARVKEIEQKDLAISDLKRKIDENFNTYVREKKVLEGDKSERDKTISELRDKMEKLQVDHNLAIENLGAQHGVELRQKEEEYNKRLENMKSFYIQKSNKDLRDLIQPVFNQIVIDLNQVNEAYRKYGLSSREYAAEYYAAIDRFAASTHSELAETFLKNQEELSIGNNVLKNNDSLKQIVKALLNEYLKEKEEKSKLVKSKNKTQ